MSNRDNLFRVPTPEELAAHEARVWRQNVDADLDAAQRRSLVALICAVVAVALLVALLAVLVGAGAWTLGSGL